MLELRQRGAILMVKFHLKMIGGSLFAFRSTRNIIKEMRSLMFECGKESDGDKYLTSIYENAKKLRNEYIKIVSAIESSKRIWKWPLLQMCRHGLDELDDLAEDCLLASDPEIRSLINEIAVAA